MWLLGDDAVLTRDEALRILDDLQVSPNIRKHCLAVEAFMRALAEHFGEDPEEWGLVGLLHDADYEATQKDLSRHPLLVCAIARERGASETVIYGILAHAERAPLDRRIGQAIYACDNLAGLIVAAALVHPERRLGALTVDFVLRKFKEKSFARSANRAEILTCETNLGIPLPEFIAIGLRALQGISDQLGL
jgi:putative nucleotidyltransferase with HDIG domain